MIVIFVIGFLFLAVAIGLLVRALAFPRVRMASQMRQIRSYGFNTDVVEQPKRQRYLLGPAFDRLAERVARFAQEVAPKLTPLTQSELTSAGIRRYSADAVHGRRVMLAVGLPALMFFVGLVRGQVMLLLLGVVFSLAAWVLPMTIIRRRSQARLDNVDRDLPELIDLLTATIEAGLGFGGSLQLVTDRFDGPLGEELRLTLREQSMGLSTENSLLNLLERCETASVRAFVRAVVQGEALGVSVGQMMRGLAIETRKRRRQAAQEKVQKAPIKMLFPLIFLIFPALLIVLLYPAVHLLISQLGSGA